MEMPNDAAPKVYVILLNLNAYEDTRDCLDSLKKVRYPNSNIVVVDNGSSDDSAVRIQGQFPDVKLLRSKENIGFAGGNNLGIEYALKEGAAYVLLLNNDTLVDPGFLSYLVQIGETDPKIGILGPKIFYALEPTRIWFAGGVVRYGRGACDHVGIDQFDDEKFSRTQDTAFITGCAMMIRAEVLGKIGMLDGKLFIYWEDNDFCMRARNEGYRCVFVPAAQIWHKISRTCGLESSFTLYLTTRNQLTWIAKHIPLPYKPLTLAFTLGRKSIKMMSYAFSKPHLAAAVGAGIRDFVLGVYGPPRKEQRRPGRQAVSAKA